MDDLKDLIEKYINEYLIKPGLVKNPPFAEPINEFLYDALTDTLTKLPKKNQKETLKDLQDFIKAFIYYFKIIEVLKSEIHITDHISNNLITLNEFSSDTPALLCRSVCKDMVASTSSSIVTTMNYNIDVFIFLHDSREVWIDFSLTDTGGSQSSVHQGATGAYKNLGPFNQFISCDFTTEVSLIESNISNAIRYTLDRIREYRKNLAKLYNSR